MGVNFRSPQGVFGSPHQLFRLYNSYSTATRNGSFRTLSPDHLFPQHQFPTLSLGDFNLHHHLPDPSRVIPHSELSISEPYFTKASTAAFSLLNHPGIYTRFPFDIQSRPSVLDLSFANHSLLPYFHSWSSSLPSTGSDHVAVSISFGPLSTSAPPPRPNWKATDWSAVAPVLQSLKLPAPPRFPTSSSLSSWFDSSLASVTTPLLSATPVKRPSSYSKPWWSRDLSSLRRIHHHTTRSFRNGSASKWELTQARNSYFKAIKKAKASHWDQFLAEADSRSIWDAKKFAYGRAPERFPSLPNASTPVEINSALITHFFPLPPPPSPPSILLLPFSDVPPITHDEVSLVLRRSSSSSAPGPDSIPYGVWKNIHRANRDLLPFLLTPLLLHGFHPPSMKKANGVVLDKPGKADYSTPSSFRIIVLLETVSKILERIMAYRLASFSRSTPLLNLHQCGSLAGLSCYDAVATLQHEVRLLQTTRLKVSSLFLDIKGGFDNVNSNQLCSMLRRFSTPRYMVSWISSFLTARQCRLVFQGAPGIFSPVSVGTPQGSPISPLLFVIYVSRLHISIPRGVVISYVDDFSITVGSPSYRSNIRLLQRAFFTLSNRAAPLGVSFSVPKTELIHWRTSRDRNPVSHAPISINALLFPPAAELRWLGYWLTPTMETSSHFHRRLALAWAAFALVKRLSPAGKGLSPWCCRKLAVGLLFPILTYGADLFLPNATILRKLDSFWHEVLRWATNCFRATAPSILYRECSLPPISIALQHKRRLAALRLLCSPPHINPATARLDPRVPTWDPWRTPSHRKLLAPLRGSYRPRLWSSAPSSTRRHLPLDAIAFSVKDLLPDKLPLASPHLLLPRPYDPAGAPPYVSLKSKAVASTFASWSALPPPSSYKFPPSFTPHAFMGLPKFSAGRLHQMRAGKSYLAAHTSWSNRDASPTCPFCEEADESFDHAILHCPAKAQQRATLLQGISSLAPDAPVWSSAPLILSLARYISSTATGFPPSMPPVPSPSPPASPQFNPSRAVASSPPPS